MIEREITHRLTTLFEQYPFVTVTGPRQSGKTTLCRATFPDLTYVNLEAPDTRDFAESDPRGFLAWYREGAIIDEIQHVPEILSYLQVFADESGKNSLFVLTGSEQFRLSDSISQSLAGRTALLRLLPFSLAERRRAGASDAVDDVLFSGFYPRIHDQRLDPRQALRDYFATYVERDVRRLGQIRNLSSFRHFVRLCAGRVGQLINLNSLGSDAGVSHTTAKAWLTILERSYIAFRLPPFHANIRKRLVKSSKLYFYDVGLASYLIGIERAEQLVTHPLRGALFENAVVVEALKHRFNQGRDANLSFFRDAKGLECDLLYETARGIGAIEVKSGATFTSKRVDPLTRVAGLIPEVSFKAVVYGGAVRQSRSDYEVVPLSDLDGVLERLEADQEIAQFVKERRVPKPDKSDMEKLDDLFQKHIRPTLSELDSVIEQLGQLFEEARQEAEVIYDNQFSSGCGLFEPNNWEMTKQEQIVNFGLDLNRKSPLILRYSRWLQDHTGIGNKGFDVLVSFAWRMTEEEFSRHVSIDGVLISSLDTTVQYSELDVLGPDVDSAIAMISRNILSRIEALSNA